MLSRDTHIQHLKSQKKIKGCFEMSRISQYTGANALPSLQEPAGSKEMITHTLAYFDIFHYPLTAGEIRQFMSQVVDERTFGTDLQQLQDQGIIFFHHGFYSLQDNPLLSHRRKQGNLLAENLLVKAGRIGRFLHQFPFVRAIGISGSLSKNYADEKADIDFFIITENGRLWIARTLMHLYKKFTFMLGRQHYYCMNYYVDRQALQLEDKNIFTAIEIKTLLPVSGDESMQQFFASNPWTDELLPACPFRERQGIRSRDSWFKLTMEWLMAGQAGTALENWLFKITQRRWKRKEEKGRKNKKGQPMELITGKHFARSNPGAFQEKVLAIYEQKLARLKILNHIDIVEA
jgi:hypothetical protein